MVELTSIWRKFWKLLRSRLSGTCHRYLEIMSLITCRSQKIWMQWCWYCWSDGHHHNSSRSSRTPLYVLAQLKHYLNASESDLEIVCCEIHLLLVYLWLDPLWKRVNEFWWKCMLFNQCLSVIFRLCMQTNPGSFSKLQNTRSWITPVIKSMIIQRWNANRWQNIQFYGHLKHKAELEIEEREPAWTKRMTNKSVEDCECCALSKTKWPMTAFYFDLENTQFVQTKLICHLKVFS